MPKLTVKLINKNIAQCEVELEDLTAKQRGLTVKLEEAKKELRKSVKEIEVTRNTIDWLQELAILTAGLPPDITQLRREYVASKNRTQSDEITVRQAREARERTSQLRKQLEESCPHTLMVYSQAYEGSSSMDYDDRVPEHRRCLICGLVESGPKFEKMTPGPGKILRYQYHMHDNLKPPYLNRDFFVDDEKGLVSHFDNRTLATLRENLTSGDAG